jgi:hypothetical protein
MSRATRRRATPVRAAGADGAWPALPLAAWRDTYDTLHRWAQLVGKTRLALAPRENHWWHTTLYVTARGLTTSPIPYGDRAFEVDFDFVDHNLIVRTGDGAARALALVPRSVADFYREYTRILDALGLRVRLWPVPVEVERAIPCDEDTVHASYDAEAAHRFWRALAQADRVLKAFRGRFLGKSSPVHFFWGSFDLACTRFSGRRAPEHPGGVPNVPDWVTREAYSHECISAGWWPGGGPVQEPAFYAYAYPEPKGLAEAPVRPAAARYHPGVREFLLPYDAVRAAERPDEALLEFLQSTYEAAADLAGWDRAALERAGAGE